MKRILGTCLSWRTGSVGGVEASSSDTNSYGGIVQMEWLPVSVILNIITVFAISRRDCRDSHPSCWSMAVTLMVVW